MKGRTPRKAEKEWMDKICQVGCIVCWQERGLKSDAEVHHIAGSRKKGAHFKTIPLCFLHHREGSQNSEWASRHPWKAEFEKRYGKEIDLLELTKKKVAVMVLMQQALVVPVEGLDLRKRKKREE